MKLGKASSPPSHQEDMMGGKAKHLAFYCAEGSQASYDFRYRSHSRPPNLDVNVLETALTSRLQIVVCVPPHPALKIIHPDRVVFIKVRLGEDKM